jgi:hypothetical protein
LDIYEIGEIFDWSRRRGSKKNDLNQRQKEKIEGSTPAERRKKAETEVTSEVNLIFWPGLGRR